VPKVEAKTKKAKIKIVEADFSIKIINFFLSVWNVAT